MRLSFSESDIDPQTQLSPAVHKAAAENPVRKDSATGWVDPNKTRVVPAAELAAWHAMTSSPTGRPAGGKDAGDGDAEQAEKNEPKTFLGLNLPQVIGGVLASTTAAILGAQLGLAGSVVGAAMTTGIITVGGAIYSHWINKTHSGLGSVASRFGRGGAAGRKGASDPGAEVSGSPKDKAGTSTPDGKSWRARISPVKLLATAAAIFVIAAVVVTGLEALRGESFAGGGQTTVGQISERSSNSGSSSDGTSTEPQRSAAEPSATPAPARPTTDPTPSSQPTPTADDSTAPMSGDTTGSGSDSSSTDESQSDGSSGSDGAGSSSAQSDSDAPSNGSGQ